MAFSTATARLALSTACGACAFGLALAITEPAGPGLDPDAVSYVMAASTLVHDHALRAPTFTWATPTPTVPLAHFPPGFSAVIAIPIALGMSPVQGARLGLAAGALVATAAAAWIVAGAVGLWWGALAALLLVITPALVESHLAVLSEPLFLAMLVLALGAMTRQRDRPIVYGCLAAAACMMRYAGVSATAAVVLWALWSPGRGGSWRDALRRAVIAGAPSVIVLGAWVFRSAGLEQSEIRAFGVYPDLGETMRDGIATVAQWLAPAIALNALRTGVALIALLAVGALVVRVTRALERDRTAVDASHVLASRVLAACGLLSATYALTLIAARLSADPNIPFDARLLSPIFVFATIAAAIALAVWWRGAPRWGRIVACAAIAAWAVGSLLTSRDDVRYALDVGVDFADGDWRGSRLVEWARHEGRGRALFSNFPTALYFHAAREAWPLPATVKPEEVRAFTDSLVSRNGLIVAFTRPSEYVPPPEPLLRVLPVHAIATFREGAIWALDDSVTRRGARPAVPQR
ncbi:MAG: hypothetical protein ABJD07_00625 [Gemmatimonadaceae bacterium]